MRQRRRLVIVHTISIIPIDEPVTLLLPDREIISCQNETFYRAGPKKTLVELGQLCFSAVKSVHYIIIIESTLIHYSQVSYLLTPYYFVKCTSRL